TPSQSPAPSSTRFSAAEPPPTSPANTADAQSASNSTPPTPTSPPGGCSSRAYSHDLRPLQEEPVSSRLDREPWRVLDVLEAMNRIEDITERRLRLWRQEWEAYERDFEARIARYTKLLEEEFAAKRPQRTANE